MSDDILAPRGGYTEQELRWIAERQTRIDIARVLLRARIEARLSQEELARRAGTTQARISELESMNGNPRLVTLDRSGQSPRGIFCGRPEVS